MKRFFHDIGQITKDAVSSVHHVPGYVLNGLKKTCQIADGKEEIKAKLGKFANDAISVTRPLPGYVWNGIAYVPAKAGEIYKNYDFAKLLDEETKDKLGKFAQDWISAGKNKARKLYGNANEFINSLDDDTKVKLEKLAYRWMLAGIAAGIEGITGIHKAAEIYENANEFVNSLDDDTKEKLEKFAYDWISNGIATLPIKAGEVYENANEFINSLDDDTKEKLVFVVKFAGGATLAVGGATLALPALGFCVAGVKSASAAAFVHSMIGNVASGSTFALLQSAGVLGFAVKTKVALGIAGGYLLTAPSSWPPLKWPLQGEPFQPGSSEPGSVIFPLLWQNFVDGNLAPASNLAVLLTGTAFGLNASTAMHLATEIEIRSQYPNTHANQEPQGEEQH